ncbi:putative ferric-chelate reductase 1 isoform X2 [Mastacembelus armatus]|uniref:putative ferric-chelate reductase 1 isoform X2 n=1 Tax=Mastacembelus armatus TaxID=205130 RepID=UPI000E457301|nr:putative ferric-chelate reductase 1 isoform X2 [Mastacembelus armatus]
MVNVFSCLYQHCAVTIKAQSGTSFEGFLLQAREVGGLSPVGSFALTADPAQLLACSEKANSAVSHRGDSDKTSVQVTWTPDAPGNGKSIQFHASFVQHFGTFWVGVTSSVLAFTGSSTSASTTPATSTTTPTTTTTTPTTSTTTPTTTTTGSKSNISSAGCGVDKVCLRNPSNCDPSVSTGCFFMSARMSPSRTSIRYEMTGPSNGYVSFGFSDDKSMGNDDIYICGIGSDGVVFLKHAFSTGEVTPQTIALGSVLNMTTSVQGTVISCSFTSMNTISTQRTTGFNNTYYIMFAYGPISNGQIQKHTDTFISADKVDLTTPTASSAEEDFPPILKAHGALMLISWMTTGSLGMITARHLKGVSRGLKLCGKDMWFVVHAVVMCVTVAATIIAFILAFSYTKDWSGGAHPVLGCLVMILSFLQPIVAFMRCAPQHSLRFLFNWTHAVNALVIKALAVAAILTGLEMVDNSVNQWMMSVMGGFIGWEALFFILLDVHLKWKVKHTETASQLTTYDNVIVVVYFLGNLAFLVALLVGIGRA